SGHSSLHNSFPSSFPTISSAWALALPFPLLSGPVSTNTAYNHSALLFISDSTSKSTSLGGSVSPPQIIQSSIDFAVFNLFTSAFCRQQAVHHIVAPSSH
ncbi:hypothetical protein K503DRAFT_809413, partial [Rhizopogon vinicolor AM-OR11-026]